MRWQPIEENDPIRAMAADEALLATIDRGKTCLRAYTWRDPALTIGVFCSLDSPPPIPWARRITGGGLVLHGFDLTFAIVSDDLPNRTAYLKVGEALANALQQLGVTAKLGGETRNVHGTYACFAQPVAGDIMVEGRKLAGYAMRRRRGRILIQGSLQLSSPTPELIEIVAGYEDYSANSCGLNEFLKERLEIGKIVGNFAEELARIFPEFAICSPDEPDEAIIVEYISHYIDPELTPARRNN